MKYDENNIFFKIINKIIPAEILLEDQNFLSIKDINPLDKFHILILSKRKYINYTDFLEHSSNEEILECSNFIKQNITFFNLKNYKIISNTGDFQEIRHLHFHLIGH